MMWVGGPDTAPLLLELHRMHFLKEENHSSFSSGQNLSSSGGSAGPSATSLSASGTTPLDQSSAAASSSTRVWHALPPRIFTCPLFQRSRPPGVLPMPHSQSTTAHSPPVPFKTHACPLAPAAHSFTPRGLLLPSWAPTEPPVVFPPSLAPRGGLGPARRAVLVAGNP